MDIINKPTAQQMWKYLERRYPQAELLLTTACCSTSFDSQDRKSIGIIGFGCHVYLNPMERGILLNVAKEFSMKFTLRD
jgi:hypothetical protein